VTVAVFTSEQGGIYPKNLANQSEVKIPRGFDSLYLITISRVFHRLKLFSFFDKVCLERNSAKKLSGVLEIDMFQVALSQLPF
jgi:hypothetical protein